MAKSTVHGFISEIENICECSICCHEYDDEEHIPRVLPCQHAFCTICLSKQCRRQRLKCPLCNQEHYIKNGNVNNFPKDFTRRDLKEVLDKYSGHLCKECHNHHHVQYLCKTCNVRMCHICYSQRNAGRCSSHDIEKQEVISSAQNVLTLTADMPSNSVCFLTGHEKNELKYFCIEKSCCKPVCANCVVESHKEHTTKPVEDEYGERKKVMLQFCQATRNKITNAKIFLDTVRQSHALVTKSDNEGRINLKKQVERGKKYITDFQEKTEKCAEERLQKCLKMLQRREEQVQSFIENSSECCAISEGALAGESIVAFLSVEKTLTEKLKSFERSDVDKPLDTMPPASDFELKEPTLDLENKIDRMASKCGGTFQKLSYLKEVWKFLSGKTQPQQRPSFLSTFISLFFVLFIYACLLLKLHPVPYSRVFDIDHTYLAFRKIQSSQVCFSTDKRMASNHPLENIRQTCGSTRMPYIFRGAFTNTSFVYGSEERIALHIDVSRIKKYSPGLILFEFGVSKGAINRQDLLGPLSHDFFGWMLTVMDWREMALINPEGHIVHSITTSVFDKVSFDFYVEFKSNRTIILKNKDKNRKVADVLDETKSIRGKPKWGFIKMCRSDNAYVTIKLQRSNIAFNKSTLYPTLYIGDENRTISNIPKSSLSKKTIQKKDHAFHDIMLLNCETKCVYVLYFRVKSPTVKEVFSLILTNSQFLPSAHYNVTLFTYTRCSVTNYVTYESFCFLVYRGNKGYSFIPMAPDEWHSLTIMVNRQRKSASFVVGNYELEVENGYIFEQDTPILRSSMLTFEDSVEIYLSESDDFDILKWFACKVFPYVDFVFSQLPIRSQYLCVLSVVIAIVYFFYNREGSQPSACVDAERISKNFADSDNQEPHRMQGATRRRRQY